MPAQLPVFVERKMVLVPTMEVPLKYIRLLVPGVELELVPPKAIPLIELEVS